MPRHVVTVRFYRPHMQDPTQLILTIPLPKGNNRYLHHVVGSNPIQSHQNWRRFKRVVGPQLAKQIAWAWFRWKLMNPRKSGSSVVPFTVNPDASVAIQDAFTYLNKVHLRSDYETLPNRAELIAWSQTPTDML